MVNGKGKTKTCNQNRR